MTKREFLRQLEMNLMIGEEEKNEVMCYYTEYFEEAGPENEQEVLAELGDPVALAGKLTAECADALGQSADPSGQNSEGGSGADQAESGAGGDSRRNDKYNYNSWGKWGRDLGSIINEAVQSAMSAAGVVMEETGKIVEDIHIDFDGFGSGAGEDDQESVAEAESALRDAEEDAREAIADAEQELRDVEAEAEDAREELEAARAEEEMAMHELDLAREEVEAARKDVEAAMSALTGLTGEEAEEAEERLSEAEDALTEAEEMEAEAEETLQEAADTRCDAEQELKDAEREVRNARRAVEAARREGEREIRSTQRELERIRREIEREIRNSRREAEAAERETLRDAGNARREAENACREAAAAQREAMREAEAAGRDMARAAREAAQEVGKAVRETARQSHRTVFTSLKEILNGGSDSELYYFSNMDMEPFADICVDVRNCAVSVEKSQDGRYGVEVQLAARPDDEIIVKVENGLLTVKQKNVSHRWNWGIQNGKGQRQNVRLVLPEAEYNRIDLNTSNARVEVYDLATVRELLNIDTSNGQIILENVSADEQIKLDSSNGSISAKQVCGREITADTSNAAIVMEQVLSEKVVADTSNGSIKVKNCEVTGLLNADTSNGSIEALLSGQESDYSIHADTSNAKIYVDGRSMGSEYNTRHGRKAVRLDTSNGRITIGYTG